MMRNGNKYKQALAIIATVVAIIVIAVIAWKKGWLGKIKSAFVKKPAPTPAVPEPAVPVYPEEPPVVVS